MENEKPVIYVSQTEDEASTQGEERPVIYVSQTQNGSYWKITATPCAHHNLGIIENNGYLNVRDELSDMILQAGGNFQNEPGYTPSPNGATHGVGGVGYRGYVKFDDVWAAIVYLAQYFTVIVITCNGSLIDMNDEYPQGEEKPVIYVSQTEDGSYWKITDAPCDHQNIGIIENNGWLNAKADLIAMILRAGGNFQNEPGYTPSPNGATHGVGGIGYIGYVHYDNCMDAIVYLLRYFTIMVIKCN